MQLNIQFIKIFFTVDQRQIMALCTIEQKRKQILIFNQYYVEYIRQSKQNASKSDSTSLVFTIKFLVSVQTILKYL